MKHCLRLVHDFFSVKYAVVKDWVHFLYHIKEVCQFSLCMFYSIYCNIGVWLTPALKT